MNLWGRLSMPQVRRCFKNVTEDVQYFVQNSFSLSSLSGNNPYAALNLMTACSSIRNTSKNSIVQPILCPLETDNTTFYFKKTLNRKRAQCAVTHWPFSQIR